MGVFNMQMGQKAAANNMAKSSLQQQESLRNASKGSNASSAPYTSNSCRSLEECVDMAEQKLQDFENMILEEDGSHSELQKKFDMLMGGIIVVNILWIAIEMDFGPEDGTPVQDRLFWFVVNSCFLTSFIMEIFVRLYWERCSWPCHLWNWFDVVIVACAVLDQWVFSLMDDGSSSLGKLTILRLARLIRLIRMVKLVRTLHSLYVMVMAFLHALKSMLFLGIITFFGLLIFSIIATVMIGRNKEFESVQIYDDTAHDRFGKVYASMYSLFELMTLEGWQLVARPLVEKNPLCFLFIGSFIMIFTYGLLNMVVATVVEKTLEQTNQLKAFDQQQELRRFRDELLSIKSMFTQGDDDKCALTEDEFDQALTENESLRSTLKNLGVPCENASELFLVLDDDGNRELTIPELVAGVGKLHDGQVSVWDGLATNSAVKGIRSSVTSLQQQVTEISQRQASIESRLEEQGEMMREVLTRVRYSLKSPPAPPTSGTGMSERKGVAADVDISPVVMPPTSPHPFSAPERKLLSDGSPSADQPPPMMLEAPPVEFCPVEDNN